MYHIYRLTSITSPSVDSSSLSSLVNAIRTLRRLPRDVSRRGFFLVTGFVSGVAFRFAGVFLLEFNDKLWYIFHTS